MAVEIPVIVDIEQAFQDAANNVQAAMKPLQREISEHALNFKIATVEIDENKVDVTLRRIKEEGAETFGGLGQLIDIANKRLVELAASANKTDFTAMLEVKHYLEDMSTASQVAQLGIEGLANSLRGIRANISAAKTTLETSAINSPEWKEAAINLKAYEEELRRVQDAIRQVSVEQARVDFSAYMNEAAIKTQAVAKHTKELSQELKGIISTKDVSFFPPDADKVAQRVVTALQQAQDALNNMTGFQRHIEELSTVNFGLLQMRDHYQRLEEESRKMSTSIEGYRTRLQDINDQWNRLTATEKYVNGNPSLGLTRQGQNLYTQFVNQTKELEKQGRDLTDLYQKEQRRTQLIQQGAKKRQYENAILNATVKTMRTLQEQERILSERLNKTAVGSSAYETLKKQLQAVRIEIEKINRDLGSTTGQTANLDVLLGKTENRLATLVKRSVQLFALHSAGRFIHNIREVTSEFEMQRVALAGIIQDTAQAESLFKQLKAAAIKSPFEIKELVTFTKQLSAYRIETDKLFDVTMQLADVSAGLGVDMNRLVLAYGQVRAASVLRGQELRQFTEAGIPLVELLAEKFTELNGRMVSTADVFELISKRAVPFSMIEEIFNDMTESGGMFYKMQEKQSETLLGQWQKLKDALSIMYDEMGNTATVHSAMEKMFGDAMRLMQNWRLIGGVVKAVGVQFISLKVLSAFLPSLTRNVTLAKKAEDALAKSIAAADMAAKTGSSSFKRASERFANIANHLDKAAMSTNVFSQTWHRMAASLASGAWVGIVVTALTAIVGYLIAARKEAERLGKELNQNIAKGGIQIQQAERNFKRLADAAVQAAEGSSEQREALKELQRTYGDVIPSQDLQIEKLRELKGNYDSLTNAIRQKIEMQIHEQNVNQITETYGSSLGAQRKGLERFLKKEAGYTTEETTRIIEGINDAIKDGLLAVETDFYDAANIIRDIIERQTGAPASLQTAFGFLQSRAFFSARTYYQKLVRSTEEFNQSLADEEERFEALDNKMGRYAARLKDIREELKKAPEGFTLDEAGTFEFNQARWKQAVAEYRKQLEDVFDGIDLAEAFTTPDLINFKEITKHISEGEGTKELKAFVEGIQKDYLNIAPQDKTTRLVTQAAMRFADEVDIAMTKVQGYLKKDETAMTDYAKSVEEFVEAQRERVHELEFTQANFREGVSNYIRPSDQDIANEKQELAFLEKLLEFVREFLKDKGPKGGSSAQDPWIILYKNRTKFMQDFQKGVEDLDKYLAHSASLGREQAIMKGRGLSLGIKTEDLLGTPEELKKWYSDAIDDVVAKIRSMGGREFAGLGVTEILAKDLTGRKIQKYQELLQELWKGLTDFDTDQMKKDLDDQLKKLTEDVKRSETARDFYKNILDLTGDEDVAASMTLSVYGGVGKDFKEQMQDQLNAALYSLDWSAIDDATFGNLSFATITQDFKTLLQYIDIFPEEWQKVIRQLASDDEKYNADLMKNYVKVLNKFDDIEQQRVNIVNKANEEIRQLHEGLALEIEGINKNHNIKDKEAAISAAEARVAAVEQGINNQRELDLSKLTRQYRLFFSTIGVISDEAASKIAKNQKEMLTEQFLSGQKTFAQYKRELNEIDEQLKKYRTNNGLLMSYLSGGLDGALNKINEYTDSLRAIAGVTADSKGNNLLTDDDKSYIDKLGKIFGGKIFGVSGRKNVYSKLFEKTGGDAKKIAEALSDASDAIEKMGSKGSIAINKVELIVKNVGALITELDGLGRQGDKTAIWWDTLANALGKASTFGLSKSDDAGLRLAELNEYALQGFEKFKSGNIIGAISDNIRGWSAVFGKSTKAIDRDIKRQSDVLEDLEYEYSRLGVAMEQAFDNNYVYNYTRQLEVLQAKIEAYNRQAELEESKGKKSDEEKVKEYRNQARDAANEMAELSQQVSEFFAGSDLASAAESFADAWLSAYQEFGDTSAAIEERMTEMVQNLMKKAALSGIAENILGNWYSSLADVQDWNAQTIAEKWKEAMALVQPMVEGMQTFANSMQAEGVSLRNSVGQFSGISRSVAGASEESITGLAAGINTQNFYMSFMPLIHENVAQILTYMTGGNTVSPATDTGIEAMPSVQTLINNHLPNIDANIGALLQLVRSVVSPKSSATATHYVSVKM